MRFVKIALIILCPLFCCASQIFAWQGSVVSVVDGDTIKVSNSLGGVEKIRLWGVDTPEKKQEWGNQAKEFTTQAVLGQVVEVEALGKDRYGRVIARVYLEKDGARTMLNQALVQEGQAWVYSQYCRDLICAKWVWLQLQAKKERRGLWSRQDPIEPWRWRRSH